MSRNDYAEIHLHVVWHTKESLPLLTPEIERFVHRYLRGRILHTPGLYFHEIGGTENHVHVAFSIAPTVLISKLVRELKGSSSHEANRAFGAAGKVLEWQTGYGVVSFGTRNLEWVRQYIRNQREHHARGTLQERLEQIVGAEEEDVTPPGMQPGAGKSDAPEPPPDNQPPEPPPTNPPPSEPP
jgi:putative transposase